MTADEMKKNLAGACDLLSKRGSTATHQSVAQSMIASELFAAEEEVESGGDSWKQPVKDRASWHLANAALHAMELIGSRLPKGQSGGLDPVKSHASSKWSVAESLSHIRQLRKTIAPSKLNRENEVSTMVKLIGECNSICKGLGHDLFETIEWAVANES